MSSLESESTVLVLSFTEKALSKVTGIDILVSLLSDTGVLFSGISSDFSTTASSSLTDSSLSSFLEKSKTLLFSDFSFKFCKKNSSKLLISSSFKTGILVVVSSITSTGLVSLAASLTLCYSKETPEYLLAFSSLASSLSKETSSKV